ILAGLKHAVFTATTGAGLGWMQLATRRATRVVIPIVALGAAIVQHVVWNAVASEAITRALCGAPTAEARCLPVPSHLALFVSVPLITALCLGPGAAAPAALARRPARRRNAGRAGGVIRAATPSSEEVLEEPLDATREVAPEIAHVVAELRRPARHAVEDVVEEALQVVLVVGGEQTERRLAGRTEAARDQVIPRGDPRDVDTRYHVAEALLDR